ncbi:MAG: thioredoxin [Bacteroidales bacterium]|nr:thioredoxin [Bacteroidales bacterium]MDD5891820.1 thioredoxin [Bacteroidales bacterium]MDY5356392.1 thioredoxin [Candidatus Cryptobacteroides sp.]
MALTINDANFAETLNTDKPVMVDFWATWCGPCRAIAPVVEELAQEYEGKAVIGKCNVDECDDVPMKYGIRSIPTLLFFKNGELVDRLVGASSKSAIAQKIDALL